MWVIDMSNQKIERGPLKCKDGDIALVLNDTLGCEQNIGKVVFVKGPTITIIRSGMQGWRIKPLHPALWAVEEERRGVGLEFVEWSSKVFHEDAWLLPLRPQTPEAVWWQVQEEIDNYLIECGQVAADIPNGVK